MSSAKARIGAALLKSIERCSWTAVAVPAAWFIAVLAATLWIGGLNPLALASPDEALNRFAAEVLSRDGQPFFTLPFPDPEDLAHPRHWVSVGDRALPAYAPATIYAYAALLRLGTLGLLLVAALPAAGAAAFAAGLVELLPNERRWLALPAPMLAFPAIYWLMRPWMNISVLLLCLCWAFYFWARWRRDGAARNLALAMFSVGAATTVRPDYAAYLLAFVLILGTAQAPAHWLRALLLVITAGAGAVAINLLLNSRVTGEPLLAAYQIVAARDEGTDRPGLFGMVRQLLMPMAVPDVRGVLEYLGKYWLQLGMNAGLTLAQLSLVPLWRSLPKLSLSLHLGALALLLCFMLSRMDPTLNGGNEPEAFVHHSMPRYWSPLFLLAVVPPILVLGAARRRALFAAGSALMVLLALGNVHYLFEQEKFSLLGLRKFQQESARTIEALKPIVPEDAMVYSGGYDKILWAHWRVGTLGTRRASARSLLRAVRTRRPVFVYQPTLEGRERALAHALRRKKLALVKLDERGLYRVERRRR